MKSTISLTVTLMAAVGLPLLIAADLMDNQIDEGLPLFRYTRPNRANSNRYTVKNCRPCGQNECQVMGMQRFSEPRCEAFGGLGSPCRMWQEPENKTLNFPDKILNCNDVYMQLCPCARGLVCDEAECKLPRRPRRPVVAGGPKQNTPRLHHELEREERDSFDVELGEDKKEASEEEENIPISFEPSQSRFPWAVARFH